MRKIVGYEGKGPSGHIVVPNAITMDHRFVPVHLGNDYTKCLGKAGDLQRENGTLTMEIELDPEYRFKLDLRKFEIHMALKELESTPLGKTGHLTIHHGIIQGVSFFPKRRRITKVAK